MAVVVGIISGFFTGYVFSKLWKKTEGEDDRKKFDRRDVLKLVLAVVLCFCIMLLVQFCFDIFPSIHPRIIAPGPTSRLSDLFS